MTALPPVLPQRFRMLMASPAACYKLFRKKQKEGHGEATMFKGKGTAGTFGQAFMSAETAGAAPQSSRPEGGSA